MAKLDCACHVGGYERPPCSVPGGCGSVGCDDCAPPTGYLTGDSTGADEPTCLGCGRTRPDPERVCQRCRDLGQQLLHDLPDLWRRLELELVPTQGVGEKVTSSSPHSAPAARLAALSLRTRSLQPLTADRTGPPGWTPEGADLSIPDWARAWARAWRHRSGHTGQPAVKVLPSPAANSAPEPPTKPPAPPLPPGGDPEDWAREYAARLREWRLRVDTWHAERREDAAWRAAEGGRTVLGLGAARPVGARPDDPVEEQWTRRHGSPAESFALGRNVAYLAKWWGWACDDEQLFPDVGEFLAGLKRLTKQATLILEGRAGDVYIGRCPRDWYDRDADATVPCGAELWIDPFVSVIRCPRCRAEWNREKPGEFLALAGAQMAVWPR